MLFLTELQHTPLKNLRVLFLASYGEEIEVSKGGTPVSFQSSLGFSDLLLADDEFDEIIQKYHSQDGQTVLLTGAVLEVIRNMTGMHAGFVKWTLQVSTPRLCCM